MKTLCLYVNYRIGKVEVLDIFLLVFAKKVPFVVVGIPFLGPVIEIQINE